jgi:hypothetical protein
MNVFIDEAVLTSLCYRTFRCVLVLPCLRSSPPLLFRWPWKLVAIRPEHSAFDENKFWMFRNRGIDWPDATLDLQFPLVLN